MLPLVILAFVVALGPVTVAFVAKALHWSLDRSISGLWDAVLTGTRKLTGDAMLERVNGIGVGLGSAALCLADADFLLAAL